MVELEKEKILDLVIRIKEFYQHHYQGCASYVDRECDCPFGLSQRLVEVLSYE